MTAGFVVVSVDGRHSTACSAWRSSIGASLDVQKRHQAPTTWLSEPVDRVAQDATCSVLVLAENYRSSADDHATPGNFLRGFDAHGCGRTCNQNAPALGAGHEHQGSSSEALHGKRRPRQRYPHSARIASIYTGLMAVRGPRHAQAGNIVGTPTSTSRSPNKPSTPILTRVARRHGMRGSRGDLRPGATPRWVAALTADGSPQTTRRPPRSTGERQAPENGARNLSVTETALATALNCVLRREASPRSPPSRPSRCS